MVLETQLKQIAPLLPWLADFDIRSILPAFLQGSEWLTPQTVKELTFPVVMALGLLYLIAKAAGVVWAWLTKQVDESRILLAQQGKEFNESFKGQGEQFAETIRKLGTGFEESMRKQSEELRGAMREIRDEIARSRKA